MRRKLRDRPDASRNGHVARSVAAHGLLAGPCASADRPYVPGVRIRPVLCANRRESYDAFSQLQISAAARAYTCAPTKISSMSICSDRIPCFLPPRPNFIAGIPISL